MLGVAVAVLLALFAFDAFDGGPWRNALLEFGMHLIPAAVVGVVAGLGWRFPWLGAIGFGALAVAYAATVPDRLDWILVISGPLALVAILFAVSGAAFRRPSQGLPTAG